jgi:hypothetical protein
MEYLLHHGADVNIEDFDSYTPFELYFSNPNNTPSSLPPEILALFTPKKDLEQARQARKHTLQVRKMKKKEQLREFIKERYTPKHPELFSEWREEMFHQDFLQFANSPGKTMARLKGIIEEVAPRVFAFRLFSLDYCRYLYFFLHSISQLIL